MTVSDEALMAFADGELDAAEAARVEAAVAVDPALAARVAEHKAVRESAARAFAPVLDEDIPSRLFDLLRPPAPVVDLAAARAVRRGWRAREWGAMAASLAAGFVIAFATQNGGGGLLHESGGRIVADGALDRALSTEIGGVGGKVSIGVTFKSKDGAYCRTFTAPEQAGLACREGGAWDVRALAHVEGTSNQNGYRMAASELPREISALAERMMAGDALDADQVKAARDKHWRK